MTDHKKFIDGSWYDEQYSRPGARYFKIYSEPAPAWAEDANLFHARFVQALFGLNNYAGVLDLGSGVGRQIQTWKRIVHHCEGVELSQEAFRHKLPGVRIHYRSATDLSCFDDGQFKLVYSNAFMEHIAPEITGQVLRESMRVAKWGAHWIPMDAGDDPSHIHIQNREEWIAEMLESLGSDFCVGCVENPVDDTQPLFVISRLGEEPWPMTRVPTYRLGGENND